MKVFLVQRGEYYDRTVIGAFSSKEKASLMYLNELNFNSFETITISDYEIDEYVAPDFAIVVYQKTGDAWCFNEFLRYTEFDKPFVYDAGQPKFNDLPRCYIKVKFGHADNMLNEAHVVFINAFKEGHIG